VEVRLQRGASRPRTAATDEDGRYEFSGLTSGRYTLAFAKAGFVSVEFGQRSQFDETLSIELRTGQIVDGLTTILPTAGAIEGRVADNSGEPIVEARVSAFRIQFADGQRRLVPAGKPAATDDRGHYRIYGLSPGDYLVAASLGSRTATATESTQDTGGFAPTYFPSTEDPSIAEVVQVRVGTDAFGIDITFRKTRLARISGTVTRGNPGHNSSTLLVLRRLRSGAALLQGGTVAVTQAQADGRFAMPGIPPGSFLLEARTLSSTAVDAVASTGRIDSRTFGEAEYASLPVMVGGVDLSDLRLATVPTGRISGHVLVDGQAYRPPAGPAPRIAAVAVDLEAWAAGPAETAIGPEGTFELEGLVGRFVLRMAGLPPALSVQHVTLSGRDVTDSGLEASYNTAMPPAEVNLTSRGTELGARVSVAEGGDVDGCTVVLFATDREKWSRPATRYLASARPDRDGTVQINGLPPGSYYALAVAYVEKGQWRDPEFLRGAAAVASTVTLRPGVPTITSLACQVR
jgi:hypothetical protein